MRRDHRTIQGALPLVARTIGRKLDVTVGIGGADAYTDGSHIQLPALPLDMKSEDLSTLAFGYLEHEAAHVRYTDMDNFKPENGLHQMFTNIFEDVRIEKALGEEYPGFAEDLRGLTAILIDKGEMGGAPDPDAPLAARMGEYVLLRGRYDVLGPEALKAPAERAEAAFRDAVPPGLATRVGAALGRLPELQTTEEASNLAREVIRLVEEEAEQQQQAAQRPEEDDAPGSGAPGDGPGATANGEQGDGQAGAGGHDPGGSQDRGDSQESTGGEVEQGEADGSSSGPGQDDAAKAAAEMAEALQELLQDSGQNGPRGQGEAAADALQQEAAKAPHRGGNAGAGVGKASEPFAVTASGAAEIAKVAGATIALRTRLRGLLVAENQSHRRPARRGKRIDRNRIVKAMTGNPRIFVNKRQGVQVNTAVQVLLDRSGSMHADMELARESALACGLGLAEIQGVSLAAAAFPGSHADDTEVIPLTRFGESARRTAGRYASLNASGGTPMLQALLWAVDQLLVQSEPRKVCLIVTDGEPFNPPAVADAIRRCWAGGIEVMGIGIGRDAHYVKALFPVSAHVDDVDALAGAMFGMMREALGARPAA